MPLKAAFLDVGDTLVEHWAPRDDVVRRARERVCAELGELPWLEDLAAADLEPVWASSYAQELAARRPGAGRYEPPMARQETERWYREWFERRGIAVDGIDIPRLLSLMCVPLEEISSPVAGARDALRWCVERGLRVVLVTNTLARGDLEALEDWRRFGVGDVIHAVVSSHTFGWRKPHPAIFERALELAEARPSEAFHVGDNLIADVWGARQVGLKAIWRRPPHKAPPTDERGVAPSRAAREGAEACRHPSERLVLAGGEVRCLRCGGAVALEIRPDAIVDDLTELPRVVEPWLARA